MTKIKGGGQAVHLHEDGGTDQGHLENGETIKIEVPPNLQGDQLSQGQRVLLGKKKEEVMGKMPHLETEMIRKIKQNPKLV